MKAKPMRKKAPFLVLILALSMFLGCTSEVVEFGAVLPLTGQYQSYGKAIANGVQLAYEELEADPDYGTPLGLTVLDSESDPAKAKALLEQLYGDGALAVIGGATSSEAIEMVSVADKFDRVLISPSASSPELTGVSPNFYRICPSDYRDGTKMATFAFQSLNLKKMAILAEEQPYASGIQDVFRKEFERLGGEVIEVSEYPEHTSDFDGLIERMVSLEPDGVYLAAYADALGMMIKKLRALDYQGKILTTHAFASPSIIAEVGEAAKNVFLTQTVFELDSEHAHVSSFVTAYEQKYGQKPDIFAAQGYDAMRVLAESMKGKEARPSEVPKGLGEEFSGVTGGIRFDDKGDAQKYPRVYIIGEGLLLYDYDALVKAQQEEIRRQKEQLEERLRKLREEMRNDN